MKVKPRYTYIIFTLGLVLGLVLGNKALPPKTVIVKEFIEVTDTQIVEVVEEKVKYKVMNGEEFIITAYCSCEICTGVHSDGITASGSKVKHGRTIAVDPGVIPLGSKVVVEGFNSVFIAEDTGNPDYMSGKRIDIYFDSHEEALEFGRKKLKVWLIEE